MSNLFVIALIRTVFSRAFRIFFQSKNFRAKILNLILKIKNRKKFAENNVSGPQIGKISRNCLVMVLTETVFFLAFRNFFQSSIIFFQKKSYPLHTVSQRKFLKKNLKIGNFERAQNWIWKPNFFLKFRTICHQIRPLRYGL